jgi:GrpB-like predicted nucleotidyltransferase (UPF0157 family)
MTQIAMDEAWRARYEAERRRLLDALGRTTTGGIVEAIQPVGSSSVPGLEGSGVLDVAMAVWPYPLAPASETALAALGYQALPVPDEADEKLYAHAAGVRLRLSEAGMAPFYDAVLLRDYLRHDAAARAEWAEAHAAGPAAQAAWLTQALAPASRWWVTHTGFRPVEAAAAELAGFEGLWLVGGGWALDLHVGAVGRVHHDVDVVVPFAGQLHLQAHLLERHWDWLTPLDGKLEPWPRAMELHLPRHQAHAHREDDFIDFLLTDISEGVWHYRRDPVVVRTLERAARRTPAGLPYLAPELVLLFKSKNTSRPLRPRPKDQADFERTLPHLDPEQRAWLRWALTATEPDHTWIGQLL